MLRILFVAQHYFANPDFVRLSVELSRRKHQVSVATSLRSVDKQRSETGIDLLEIEPFVRIYSIPYTLSFPFSKMYNFVQKRGVQLIHTLSDLSTNTASAALVSRTTGVPLVHTIQGIGVKTDSPLVNGMIDLYDWTVERQVAKAARKVILLSKRLAFRAEKLGVNKDRRVVIPSGVDYDYFDSERPEVQKKAASLREELDIGEDVVVGYVGRLSLRKGLTYLLQALRKIQREYSNTVLLVVGDGEERRNLEMIAKKSEIRAVFAGWQKDVLPYYAVMDVFVLPSLFEGLPNVMLEAMAMEKPLVATDVGANPDLVADGRNGFLVSVRDHEQIASALKRLIENPDLRKSMGVTNRRIVEKFFSWDKIVRQIEKLYNLYVRAQC